MDFLIPDKKPSAVQPLLEGQRMVGRCINPASGCAVTVYTAKLLGTEDDLLFYLRQGMRVYIEQQIFEREWLKPTAAYFPIKPKR